MDAGIRADAGRFDLTWTARGYYTSHYTEGEQLNYEYDRHPRADVPEKHLHDPQTRTTTPFPHVSRWKLCRWSRLPSCSLSEMPSNPSVSSTFSNRIRHGRPGGTEIAFQTI
jgi:hypothetical protein